MTRRAITRCALALAGLVFVASACGGTSSDDGQATSAPAALEASTDAASATTSTADAGADEATEEAGSSSASSTEPSMQPSAPSADGAISTGGDQPTFTWAPVEGAALYSVVVATADGSAFWAWQGAETTATVGDGAPDPLVSADMVWSVVALSEDGDGLWESGWLPI